MSSIKAKSSVTSNNDDDTIPHNRERPQAKEGMDPFATTPKVTAQVETNKVKNLLANLKRTSQLN